VTQPRYLALPLTVFWASFLFDEIMVTSLRTSKWMACMYFTNSLGYGVILVSHDCIFCLVPLFMERQGNCPNFCQKIWHLFYCHSPDGTTTEQTHCCYGEWYNSSHLVLHISSFSLLAFRSQNQRMDGSWVCYGRLWEWCYFDIPWLDSLPRPLFSRRWGNCPKFCQKIWRCRRLVSCHNETTEHMKTGIYPFKRAIIVLILVKNMQVSFYPF